MIRWQFFPKSRELPKHLGDVVAVFEKHENRIGSAQNKLSSDKVLAVLRDDLVAIGFQVEVGKTKQDKIKVPVLFGQNGRLEKYFEADGFNPAFKVVMEVEAGRAVTNYQFLKDFFQACVMHDVDFLVIAVRQTYRKHPDFEKIISFFDALFASGRMVVPLQGILVVGY